MKMVNEEHTTLEGTLTEQSTLLPQNDKKESKYYGVLGGTSLFFILLFGTQTVMIKYLDDDLGFKLEWFTCMLLSATWPVNMVIYFCERFRLKRTTPEKIIPLTPVLIGKYALLASLDATHMALLSCAVTYLPGSTYMILKTTSILFILILSRIFLKKKLNIFHNSAILLMSCSVLFVALGSSHDKSKDISQTHFIYAVIMAIGSAFGDASHTVTSDVLLKHVKKNKSVLTVAQTAWLNGMFSFSFLLPVIFISGEPSTWGSHIGHVRDQGKLTIFIIACVIISLSKQLGYFVKFGMVALSSGVFAGIVDMVRRTCVIVATALIFSEYFGWQKAAAVSCTITGFGIYLKGGQIARSTGAAGKTPETPGPSAILIDSKADAATAATDPSATRKTATAQYPEHVSVNA